jgi:hypothetical protein
MLKRVLRIIQCMGLISTTLGLVTSGVAAADASSPLKGLRGAPIVHFPTVGSACYGLDPLAQELRINEVAIRDLALAGFNFPLPQTVSGSTTTLGAISGAYIKISDNLLKLNELNCLDKLEVALVYTADVRLEHNGQMYPSRIELWTVENIIIAAGRDDYLVRRQVALGQIFTLLADEWKKQNAN